MMHSMISQREESVFEVKMKGETPFSKMERKDKELARAENFITALRFIEKNLKHFLSKSLNFDEIYDVFAKTPLLRKLLVL